METKEYFEKVMQDFNQNGNGRSLRKYCERMKAEKWSVKSEEWISSLRCQSDQGRALKTNFVRARLEEMLDPSRMSEQARALRVE